MKTKEPNEEAQPEGAAEVLAAEEKGKCLRSIGLGRLRNYLFKLRSGFDVSSEDIQLGEHVEGCPVCQERIEKLNYFEVALRNDFEQLAPLMNAVTIEAPDGKLAAAAAGTRRLQSRVARKFAGAIAEAQKIVALEAEYQHAFPSLPALRAFSERCSDQYRQLEPTRRDWVRESMIDLVRDQQSGRQPPRRRLNEIVKASGYPFEFLLGVAQTEAVATSTDRRIFYRDSKLSDPDSDIIIETDRLIPRAASVCA